MSAKHELSLIEIWTFRNCDLVRTYRDAPIEVIERKINDVLKRKEIYRKMKNGLPNFEERRKAENTYLELDGQYNVLGFVLTSRGFDCDMVTRIFRQPVVKITLSNSPPGAIERQISECLRQAAEETRPKAVAAACSLDLRAVLNSKQKPPVVDD